MRRQITCQQTGIRARDDNMLASTQKTIDEQMPTFDILDFIEEIGVYLTVTS